MARENASKLENRYGAGSSLFKSRRELREQTKYQQHEISLS